MLANAKRIIVEKYKEIRLERLYSYDIQLKTL